jgi:hypothetical protein
MIVPGRQGRATLRDRIEAQRKLDGAIAVPLARFKAAQLEVVPIADAEGEYLVAGRYKFRVRTGAAYWSDTETSAHGYGWGSLIDIARRHARAAAEAAKCGGCEPAPAIVKTAG